MAKSDSKKITPGAWEEARAVVWRYRFRLTLGFVMMLVSRLAGLVLPGMTGYIIDDVIPGGRSDELFLLGGVALGLSLIHI